VTLGREILRSSSSNLIRDPPGAGFLSGDRSGDPRRHGNTGWRPRSAGVLEIEVRATAQSLVCEPGTLLPLPTAAITLAKEPRAVTRIGVILGSTRPNRNGEQVAKWVYDIASRRGDAEFDLVDLRDYPLPHP
jgi:hypothetical protein